MTVPVHTENLRGGPSVWSPPENPPRFLSPVFHLDFFPKVLLYRYRRARAVPDLAPVDLVEWDYSRASLGNFFGPSCVLLTGGP